MISPFSSFSSRWRLAACMAATCVGLALPFAADASTTGAAFAPAYQFIFDAATGYLGRGIAITGGVIGLGVGAATGKAIPAVVGIVLGIFGSLGPTIIDTIFNTAVV